MQQKKRDKTHSVIIDSATVLFLEKGFNQTTIKDIALSANLGEATVYRHFATKEDLLLSVSVLLSQKILDDSFQKTEGQNGYSLIAKFYELFLIIFKDNKNYYRLLNDIDLVLTSHKELDQKKYSDLLLKYKDYFLEVYQKGIEDKSLRTINNLIEFYYATTHAIMSLAKKLALDAVLEQDLTINKELELKTLIDIILSYIRS